jgi:hypothetical protein
MKIAKKIIPLTMPPIRCRFEEVLTETYVTIPREVRIAVTIGLRRPIRRSCDDYSFEVLQGFLR